MWFALFLLLPRICFGSSATRSPKHVHLQWNGIPSEMVVSWTTCIHHKGHPHHHKHCSDPQSPSIVRFGSDKYDLENMVFGNQTLFYAEHYRSTMHVAVMTGLERGTQVFYQVGDGETWSNVFSFRTIDPERNPPRFAVYGDFGIKNEISLMNLVDELSLHEFDAVIHTGDIAYDLDEDHGKRGDNFLESIETLTSSIPYMLCAGNHERAENFSHYTNRFLGLLEAGKVSGSNSNRWYSFNAGLIHFVAIDTEVYKYYFDPKFVNKQLQWLEQDLAWASHPENRTNHPWIVMFGHKGSWMTNDTKFSDFEDLAHRYKVDIYLTGHEHNYQRMLPFFRDSVHLQRDPNVYEDPNFMVQIVAGSPGCDEGISLAGSPEEKQVKTIFEYGYGHLQALNRTHLRWEWIQTGVKIDKENGRSTRPQVRDTLWIIQHKHSQTATS